MFEFVIAADWSNLDSLLTFLEQTLSAAGHPTTLKLWVQTIAEEAFSKTITANGKVIGCRIQPESRLVFRIDGTASPVDFHNLPTLCARAGMKGLLVTPGSNSCMVQWS